jgi:hypothetical protein
MGSQKNLKEALAGPAKDKKEPTVADGILSLTPDPAEAAEWRNKSVLDTVAADSTFLQDDDIGDGSVACCLLRAAQIRAANLTAVFLLCCLSHRLAGKRPNQLFGKFTWTIPCYSETNSKRELRSAQFDVGEYKWYV